MKPLKNILTIVFFLAVAIIARAEEKPKESLPNCAASKISELKESGILVSISDLPSGALLARDAKVFIESKDLHLQASQDFIKPKSQILCFSGPAQSKFSVSLDVPTLIDLTIEKLIGNSIWEFNLMVDGKQVGIWDQVSHLQSNSFKLSELTTTADQEVLFSQVNHDQYELIIKQQTKNLLKAVVITFDSVQP